VKLSALKIKRKGNKPNSLIAFCPRPGCIDKSGHVDVFLDRRFYVCYKCGKGGPIIIDVPAYENVNKSTTGDQVKLDVDGVRRDFSEQIHPGDRYWKYLTGRGFLRDEINRMDPRKGNDPGRVYFPIRNLRGEVTYVTGRSILPNPRMKWWFPTGTPGKSNNLWGIHLMENRADEMILTEGVFDAVWGKNRLAIFGKSASVAQINLMATLNPKRIIIALDFDAEMAALKLGNWIAMNLSVPIFKSKLPKGSDPCDLGIEGQDVILDTAERIF
jgi:hypothetical protein